MEPPNWYTQLKIKMTPTVEKWSDMGFVEVATPDDFFSLQDQDLFINRPQIQGILCPLPKEWLVDQFSVAAYSQAIQQHPEFVKDKYMTPYDKASRISFFRQLGEKGVVVEGTGRELLPPKLVEMESVLTDIYQKTTGCWPAGGIYQIDSNHHRLPDTHRATGIINLRGPTTIMFLENARGKWVGKKSLPPQSMAVFLGCHAAPDTSLPRLNILCG